MVGSAAAVGGSGAWAWKKREVTVHKGEEDGLLGRCCACVRVKLLTLVHWRSLVLFWAKQLSGHGRAEGKSNCWQGLGATLAGR